MGKFGVITAMAFAIFFSVSSPAMASEDVSETAQSEVQGLTEIGKSDPSANPAAAIYWHFITCVHDAHECLHEAEHHGYEHYRVLHDHRSCGHHDMACYGGHH